MGDVIDFICLADSLKLNGHCVAGLRLDGRGSIRPATTPAGRERVEATAGLGGQARARSLAVMADTVSRPTIEGWRRR